MQPSSDVRVGARRATEMRARTIRRSTPHCHGGRPGRDFRKSLWSALQTHLQGVDRATLAIVPEKCRHRAALPISNQLCRQNIRACRGRQAMPSSTQIRKAREVTQPLASSDRGTRCRVMRFREIRRWRACARFRRRLRRCGRPARGSARSAAACRGNSPAPRHSPRR
jgi:hypothetical protein